MGRVNVTPVDAEINKTVSNAAKSDCEPPYGPSISANNSFSPTRDSVFNDAVAAALQLRRWVNPLCALRKNTSCPLWEEGIDAIVAG
jgi:hypothetical protein